ncbi:MAG: hypothetical protein Q9160_002040 [Pyrenula sp. 1 TL-2023]
MQASYYGERAPQKSGPTYAGVAKRRPGRPHASTIVFPTFPPETQPINPNIPLKDLIFYYPNHLHGDQLARVADANWTATMIVDNMHEDAKRQFYNRRTTSQPLNALTKRLSNIRKKLQRKAGAARNHQAPGAVTRSRSQGRRDKRSSGSTPSPRFQAPHAPSASYHPAPSRPLHSATSSAHAATSYPTASAPPTHEAPRIPRAGNARPLYTHRATFKVYVPYDPHASRHWTLTEQNIYLPYNPPRVSAEDPLGILYTDTADQSPESLNRDPSSAPEEAPNRDEFTDEEFSDTSEPPGTRRVPASQHNPPFADQAVEDDLDQLSGYPEPGQQQRRSSSRTAGLFQDQDGFVGRDIDYGGHDQYYSIPDNAGLAPDPNMRWSPTKSHFVPQTPPAQNERVQRRSSRAYDWSGLH